MMFHGLIRETEGLRWIRWLIIENGNLGNQIRLSVDRPEPFPSTIMHFPYIMSCSASPLYLKVTGVSPRHIVQWFCFSQEGFSMIWKLQNFSKNGISKWYYSEVKLATSLHSQARVEWCHQLKNNISRYRSFVGGEQWISARWLDNRS